MLKESADLVILGVTFDAKMTFEKLIRSVLWLLIGTRSRLLVVGLFSITGALCPSLSLWNGLSDPVFDGVGLAGFKSRANAFLLA